MKMKIRSDSCAEQAVPNISINSAKIGQMTGQHKLISNIVLLLNKN